MNTVQALKRWSGDRWEKRGRPVGSKLALRRGSRSAHERGHFFAVFPIDEFVHDQRGDADRDNEPGDDRGGPIGEVVRNRCRDEHSTDEEQQNREKVGPDERVPSWHDPVHRSGVVFTDLEPLREFHTLLLNVRRV
ncbi:hypothetical protein C0581_01835 [Candidatus Parcubacteria bacterium]|nr:MAG: hypothetical protein C0581_01835 [Candidatus Parcubacteria bacterium]